MRLVSRALVILFFYLPVLASIYFFVQSILRQLSEGPIFEKYWTPYIEHASYVSFSIGLVSTSLAVLISFFLGSLIFSLKKPWLEKIISFLISVPHLAFFSGVFFFVSSSGFLSRIWSHFSSHSFYGFDHDPWAISFSVALAFKESLFLILIMLPFIFKKENEAELTVSSSFGHSDFTFWTFALWPRIIQSLRYPIWMIIAFSISVVDLAILLAPTNPPPFSIVLWEFFQSTDPDSQFKSIIGSFQLLLLLISVIIAWELIVAVFLRLLKLRLKWPISRQIFYFKKSTFALFLLLQLVPIFLVLLWAFTDEWTFPNLLPSSYTFTNFLAGIANISSQILNTLTLAMLSSGLATVVILVWLEWDQLTTRNWIMVPIFFVPIVPIITFLYGFDVFLNSFLKLNPFFSVLYIHLVLVFPYVFIILKSHFVKVDPRYKVTALSLGQSIVKFFFKIRVPLLLQGILKAFSIGFAVSTAQYVSTLFVGGGKVETLTTQMVVAASSENRKWIGVYGLLQIILPFFAFVLSEKISQEKT